ncbi:MAG: Gfo/Idh/MocA family protein [Paracoccaceae bacterium]
MPQATEQKGEPSSPLRVAVIGCGAATRIYAGPALALLENEGLVRVTSLFDPVTSSVESVQALMRSATPAPSLDAALDQADLAVIASPSALHASHSTVALQRGVHVLCEKPMALKLTEAEDLVATAEARGRLLAVGLIRRHLPAPQAIKALLAGGTLGELRSVCWFEGGVFEWPVASASYFSTEQSGGGVLQDIGTHALDLLNWWLGRSDIVEYSDDAMGGVEANALLRLRCAGADVQMRLSRDWARPNRVTIQGDLGSITWEINEPLTLELEMRGSPPGLITLDDGSGGNTSFVSTYAAQIRDVIDALRSGHAPAVPGTVGRNVCALIEECYRNRKSLEMPWFSIDEQSRAVSLTGDPR